METWPDACASDQLSGKENSWLGVISTFLSPLKPCISLHKLPWDQVYQSKAVWRHLTGRRLCGSSLEGGNWGRGNALAMGDQQYLYLLPLEVFCQKKGGGSLLLHVVTHLWGDVNWHTKSPVDTPPFPYQVQCSLCNATYYQERLDIKHFTQSA